MEQPAQIGRYRIERLLGTGGMSRVYLARDPVLDRPVVVKALALEASLDEDGTPRFLAEARATSSLTHPNIVRIYDFFEENGTPFIVMEWLQGENLRKAIELGHTGDLRQRLQILAQISAALEYVHDRGIVHRDIKPENIHVDSSGHAKLMDFGISRRGNLSLSRAGTTMGTPYYMAPEQLRGEGGDTRSDVYAFGVLLFELITGTKLVTGETLQDLFKKILNEPIRLEPLRKAGASERLIALADWCTRKNPAERIPDLKAVTAALDSLIAEMPASAGSPDPGESFADILAGSDVLPAFDATVIIPNPLLVAQAAALPSPAVPPSSSEVPPSESPESDASSEPGEGTRIVHILDETAESVAHLESTRIELPMVALSITRSADLVSVGKRVRVASVPFRIGRSEGDLCFPFDPAISRNHLELDFRAGGFVILDSGSQNGTFVNGKKLRAGEPEPLLFGSAINAGSKTELIFISDEIDEMPDLTGSLVDGRYRLMERIFTGAKSAMYRAEYAKLSGSLLVKVLSPALAHHPGYREPFEREAQIACRFRHPNIHRVIDYGDIEIGSSGRRSLYLCSEFLEGGSLERRLAAKEAFDPVRIAVWLNQLADALDHVHQQDVIHGGIKPSAIVFDSRDNALLSDFGIAVTASDQRGFTLVGAPAFMAPEQWEGGKVLPATDQYSLAVVLFLALTGSRPYEGQEHPEVRKRNLRRGPECAHELAVQNQRTPLPSRVSEVFQRALGNDPGERFDSMLSFAAAFGSALSEPEATVEKPPSVFISYQRATSSPWALFFKNELEREYGYQVFVDAEQRDTAGQFPLKLERGIQRCDVFVCILGEATLSSAWVNREIELAHAAQKPMVPVFQESFRFPDNLPDLPAHSQNLLLYDGVKLLDRQNVYVTATIKSLSDAIRSLVPRTAQKQKIPKA